MKNIKLNSVELNEVYRKAENSAFLAPTEIKGLQRNYLELLINLDLIILHSKTNGYAKDLNKFLRKNFNERQLSSFCEENGFERRSEKDIEAENSLLKEMVGILKKTIEGIMDNVHTLTERTKPQKISNENNPRPVFRHLLDEISDKGLKVDENFVVPDSTQYIASVRFVDEKIDDELKQYQIKYNNLKNQLKELGNASSK